MGAAMRKASRTYNIDARVAKELAKDKRPAAPRYETEGKAIETRIANITDADRKLIPGLEENSAGTNKNIEDRLKNLHVSSSAVENVEVDPRKGIVSGRPLPVARHTPTEEVNWLGFQEPPKVAPGRLKMSSVVQLLMDIKSQTLQTPEEVADKYNIALQDAKDVQKYYGIFNLKERQHRDHQDNLRYMHTREQPYTLSEDLAQNKENMFFVWPFEESTHRAQLRGTWYANKAVGIDLGNVDEAIAKSDEEAYHAELRFKEIGGKIDDEIIEASWERAQRLTAREQKLLEQRTLEQQQEATDAEERGKTITYTPTSRSNLSGSYRFAENSSDAQNLGSRYFEDDPNDNMRFRTESQLDYKLPEEIAALPEEMKPYKLVGSPSLRSRQITQDNTNDAESISHSNRQITDGRESKFNEESENMPQRSPRMPQNTQSARNDVNSYGENGDDANAANKHRQQSSR